MFPSRLCALLFLACGCIFARQNQPNQATNNTSTALTIKAHVRQVLVPIMVTDKKGHPLSGLQESDFALFEDEVPQRIVAFTKTYAAPVEVPAQRSSGSSANASVTVLKGGSAENSPTRTYVVCVDTLHSSFGDIEQARRALAKFFQQEHDAQAQYALMNLSRRLEVIQDSTRDPSLVLSALSSKKFQSSVVNGEASSIESDSEQLRAMLNGFSPLACSTPGVRVRGQIADNCSDMKQRVQRFIFKSAERTALLTMAFLQELKAIIQALASMPTQRTLILISDGFNLVPGRELYGIASVYFPNDGEWRSIHRDTQPQLKELLRLAQKNNVAVDALDSRGIYNAAAEGVENAQHDIDQNGAAMNGLIRSDDRTAWENESAMAQLAAGTGGLYFHDNNDLFKGIRQAFDDERERYIIAYDPSNDAMDGTYRKITVNVKGKSLRVYAKAGYWAAEK